MVGRPKKQNQNNINTIWHTAKTNGNERNRPKKETNKGTGQTAIITVRLKFMFQVPE